MTIITIKDNFPEVSKRLKKLSEDIGNKALVRALNATIDQGKTQMARTISKEFRVTVGAAKDRLNVSKASAKKGSIGFEVVMEATKKGKSRAMNLINFVESKTTFGEARKRAKEGTKSQVFFQVKRSGGKRYIKGGFIGNNGRTMFIRVPGTVMASRTKYKGTKHAESIRALTTVDIPSMFNTKRINASVVKVMLQRFEENFNRNVAKISEGFIK